MYQERRIIMRMKYAFIGFAVLFIVLLAACEGPTGPQGPAGKDADAKVYQGTLAANSLVDSLYWEIGVGLNLDKWLVMVMVRESGDYAWFEPMWDILRLDSGLYTVAIYRDDEVTAGYEYRIAVIE
jgi:hypothetical protein